MKTETFNRQARVAYHAITSHMIEHDLVAPMSIDRYKATQTIRVMLDGSAAEQQTWLDSVEILDEQIGDIQRPAIGVRSCWTVRLPDLALVIELVGFRASRSLSVVTA